MNLHINNNKQTLLEKTCKRILSYNFYLVIHLFIYCGWGEKKKKKLSSLLTTPTTNNDLLFKAKTNKNVL